MRIAEGIRADIRSARKIWLPWWAVLSIAAGSLPLIWLFDHFGRMDLALPALCMSGMLGFALVVKRRLWRRVWFWIAIAAIAALQIWLVLIIPWTDRWVPAVVTIPIATAYLIGIIAILSVLESFFDGPEAAAMAAADAVANTRRRGTRRL